MRLLAYAILTVVLAGCGGSDEGPRAVIETDSGDVAVQVEVADTAAEREHGLMGRRELAGDAGMAFVFPDDTSSPFWMKNTLMPLSIAFYDDAGRIVRILDMQPCRQDPCPLYDPHVRYRGALEVNLGAFRRWGVQVGDRLRVIGNE
jgi:uncharacterized membrane protein (UPF0127 family)